MDFFTKIDIQESDIKIDYKSELFFAGSCFAENISRRFTERKFHTLVNPMGVIYNPLSIENMVSRIASGKDFTEADVFFDGERWNCFDAHGSLSVKIPGDAGREKCIKTLNRAITNAHDFLQQADFAFITLGTAFVYFLKSSGKVVSNCHKQNANLFERRLISVEEAASALESTVEMLWKINRTLHIVFTISPLRHLNDGAHGNNLSKSTLLLAVEKVCQKFANNDCTTGAQVSYFPSYEIVLDELRDYRFYAGDMIHLSETAEDYIFERMCDTFCNDSTREEMHRVEKFMKTANHKIIDGNSPQTAALAKQQIQKAQDLEMQIPGLNLRKEKEKWEGFI